MKDGDKTISLDEMLKTFVGDIPDVGVRDAERVSLAVLRRKLSELERRSLARDKDLARLEQVFEERIELLKRKAQNNIDRSFNRGRRSTGGHRVVRHAEEFGAL